MDTYYITGTSRGPGQAPAVELLKDRANRVNGMGRTCPLTPARYRQTDLDLSDTSTVREFQFRLPRGTQCAERFIQFKADGMLSLADEAAKILLRIIAQPENHSRTRLDVRDVVSYVK